MHFLNHLITLTALIRTTLAAPAPAAAPAPSSSHVLATRDAPCDAFSETCRPVINANACFAAFVMFGTAEQVLQCVDHEDPARAEELMCACYGCAETTVQDWATGTLGCSAST